MDRINIDELIESQGPEDNYSPPIIRKPKQEMIYFIQAKNDGMIKIGFSANVPQRFKALQVASPTQLVLLGTMIGGYNQEQALHQKFSKYRLHGE